MGIYQNSLSFIHATAKAVRRVASALRRQFAPSQKILVDLSSAAVSPKFVTGAQKSDGPQNPAYALMIAEIAGRKLEAELLKAGELGKSRVRVSRRSKRLIVRLPRKFPAASVLVTQITEEAQRELLLKGG